MLTDDEIKQLEYFWTTQKQSHVLLKRDIVHQGKKCTLYGTAYRDQGGQLWTIEIEDGIIHDYIVERMLEAGNEVIDLTNSPSYATDSPETG